MKRVRAEQLDQVDVHLVELLAVKSLVPAPPVPRSRSPPGPRDDAPRRRTAMAFNS